jgi:NADH-quinone oxidoreductase subunit G
MSEEKITIEVNGQTIEAVPGSMLIEATDAAGIEIPRFCYHKKLSVAANCRMCLVEVEKVPKPLPACATPVSPNMKVWTRSERAIIAQQDVMEFLLINHPLDCPICDQGGECELQDVSVAYGDDKSYFSEEKRVVFDKNIGPLIATELTRCIQCTRCVRFGEEIAGMRELGMVGRGDREKIDVFVNQSLQSELSGNAIDICPVGALTAKPSRYKARAWEINQHAGIASHDSVGTNVYHHTFRNKVMRTVPQENEAVNECWMSDRDRFSYEGLYAADRLEKPMLKRNGQWEEVDWETALEATAKTLKHHKADTIAALASPRATTEELFLFQKFMRGLGCNNIDHRLRQTDMSDQDKAPLFPWLGVSIEDLEQQNVVLLIGSNIRYEQPMLNHRLRKAVMNNDAQVMTLNPYRIEFNYPAAEQYVSAPDQMLMNLASIAKAAGAELPDHLTDVVVTDDAQSIADKLKAGDKVTVLLGNIAIQHPAYASLRALAALISDATGTTLGYLAESANTAGAWIAGAVPHRLPLGERLTNVATGKSVQEVVTAGTSRCMVLLDVEVEHDCDNPQMAKKALQQAESVIAVTPYASDYLKSTAHILLPTSTVAETSGTFVNAEGRWQSFKGASDLPGEARPTWKILRVLGNVMELDGFEYMSTEEIRDELKASFDELTASGFSNAYSAGDINLPETSSDVEDARWQRIGNVAMYATDALVRRAGALQKSAAENIQSIRMNPADADALGVDEGDNMMVTQDSGVARFSVKIDDAIPANAVQLLAGTNKSVTLGSAFGTVTLSKV